MERPIISANCRTRHNRVSCQPPPRSSHSPGTGQAHLPLGDVDVDRAPRRRPLLASSRHGRVQIQANSGVSLTAGRRGHRDTQPSTHRRRQGGTYPRAPQRITRETHLALNEKRNESHHQDWRKYRYTCRMAHTLTTRGQESPQASLHLYLLSRMRSKYLLPSLFRVRGAFRFLGVPRPPCGNPPSRGPNRPVKGNTLLAVLVTPMQPA